MSLTQTSEVPMLAGRSLSLEKIRWEPTTVFRQTKIICTIGPACWEVEQLETMMEAGMNVARLNFSHGDHEGHAKVLEKVRQAATNRHKNVAILLDTKGPEIRTGFFADGAKKIELKKGENLVLKADYSFLGNSQKLACSYESLATSVNSGQQILVADGSLVLTVLATDPSAREVTCRVENNASIGERKNMNLPGVVVDLPTFTDKDVNDIVNFGIKYRVDFIAASFVRKGSDVANLRKLLADNGGQDIKIICKIENQEGLVNYNGILDLTDSIMVARGDLGMEIPPSKVFLAQKMMIREANIAGKPVITATQMLESMITNPRPTRAECSDVANAVMDGTDAVMLSGETANGPYFEKAIRVMARTCVEAENIKNYNSLNSAIRTSVMKRYKSLSPMESLASSAVKTALDIGATVIMVISESGETARLIAKFRPGMTIICLTNRKRVARQANGLYAGVHSYKVDTLSNDVNMTQEIGAEAVKAGIAKVGDFMVVVSGTLQGVGKTNQVRVEAISRGPDENTGTIKRFKSFSTVEEFNA